MFLSIAEFTFYKLMFQKRDLYDFIFGASIQFGKIPNLISILLRNRDMQIYEH